MPVIIRRLQVEEGFLDGIDLTFGPGLNVIIGPRGTGKTSVIELLRYCLDVKGGTSEIERRAREHALSVLGSGQVTVTLDVDGREALVARNATEQSSRKSHRFKPPLVFSQSEIERVGLEAEGRLRILDGLSDLVTDVRGEQKTLESQIRSLTAEIRHIAEELNSTREEIAALESVPAELKAAIAAQQKFSRTIKKAKSQQKELDELGKSLAQYSVRAKLAKSAHRDYEEWIKSARAKLLRPPATPDWPESAGKEDLLQSLRQTTAAVVQAFESNFTRLHAALDQLSSAVASEQAAVLQIEDRARALRRELESLQRGAGAAAQAVSVLEEKNAHLSALRGLRDELSQRLRQVQEERGRVLNGLQVLEENRFHQRSAIARDLTKKLGPTLQVTVERAGFSPVYIGAIQNALRGSGLHYNVLGPQLAQTLSPRELAEAAESADFQTITRLTNISDERALRITDYLRRAGTEEIITARLDDAVTMSLLDGSEYKATPALSTGQRCTVVLSVLLGYQGRPLLIDQPEDNLDNRFIVQTLVESIKTRKSEAQLLFTTHNANIPVLGEAERVIHMGSDGHRGFARHSGPLDDAGIVEAITTVMEGGHEAFQRRAEFYRRYFAKED